MDILLAIFPLVIAGVAIWYFIRLRNGRKPKTGKVDQHTRLERAVWAWAKIVASQIGPADTSGRVKVEMQLEVHMPGTPAYQATAKWLVEPEGVGFVEAGKDLSLKVDPQGPEHVFPNGSWAKVLD